jgi:hypothetical protein
MPFGKVLGVIIHPWTKMSRKFLTCLIKRFLVDLYSTSYGAVVHSGERLICIQEVAGSNPTGSTNSLDVLFFSPYNPNSSQLFGYINKLLGLSSTKTSGQCVVHGLSLGRNKNKQIKAKKY